MKNIRPLKWLGLFLALMAGLTFISRAADAMLIANVITETPRSGVLNHMVKAQGRVEARAERPLWAESGLRIEAVHALEGSRVEVGETLVTFERHSVEDAYAKAQRELNKLNNALEQLLLDSPEPYTLQAPEALSLRDDAVAARDEAGEALIGAKKKAIDERKAAAEAAVEARQTAISDGDEALKKAMREVEDQQAALADAKDGEKKGIELKLKRAQEDLQGAREKRERAGQKAARELAEAQAAYDAIQADATSDPDVASAQQMLNERQRALDAAERKLRAAEEADEAGLKQYEDRLKQAELKREAQAEEVDAQAMQLEAQAAVDTQREGIARLAALRENGYALKSPIAGAVVKQNAEPGALSGGEALTTLAGDGDGLVVRVTITDAQARYVATGDSADITPAGRADPAKGEVILLSKPDAEGNVRLELAVESAALAVGSSVDILISRVSDSYACCVPISALRQDSTGDHVLTAEASNGVLGEALVARRVPVTVLDTDGTRAAISGALTHDAQVITRVDKAISEGDRLRPGES